MLFGWHRIIAFASPGMAARNSFQCQPAASEKAVHFQRFQSVMRTGWMIPAIFPQPRRNGELIKFYQNYNRKSEDFVQHNFKLCKNSRKNIIEIKFNQQ